MIRLAPHAMGPRQGRSTRTEWATVAPFLALLLIGLGTALLPPYRSGGAEAWLVVVLVFAVLISLAAGIGARGRWVDLVPVLLVFTLVALARDVTGGGLSGLAPLAVLPILWVAITGTRTHLLVAAGATAAVFVLPIVLIGGPAYPVADWRRGLVWTGFALMVAPVVQRLVRRLAEERERARAALAELDTVVRCAGLSSIVTTDVHGTIRSFSPGAEQLLGYQAPDVVGVAPPVLFHDADEIAAAAVSLGTAVDFDVFRELAETSAPSRIWTYVRRDRERLHVRLAVTELRDHEDRLTGYLGIAIDATAAVRNEKALAVREAQWRLLLDSLPDTTVVVLDPDLRMELVAGTGAWRQGLGGREGQSLESVSNPDNLRVVRELQRTALDGLPASAELAASTTGDPHEVVMTALPEPATAGTTLVVARDVSATRRREEALILERSRTARLFDDAPHGVVLLAGDGTVERVNDALLDLLGRSTADVLGHRLTAWGCGGDDTVEDHLGRALRHPDAPVVSESRLMSVTGPVHVTLSSRTLRSTEGGADAILTHVVDVSDRHRLERRLTELADHDPLTGLLNRRRFDEELQQHVEHCRRYGADGALLLLDLDHFKEVNDVLGHAAGDEVLVSVAHLLLGRAREVDAVARLGGDEFAVLLRVADRAGAERVAQHLVRAIADHASTLDGVRRRVTGSIGVVTLRAAQDQTADVLALADMTMYDAKDAGRNQVAVLDEELARLPRCGARMLWQERIEGALEADRFVLHLQPVVNLETGEIASAEVLLRMVDGDELVPPARFLYVAEKAGLAPAVDAWVLRHAMGLLARIREVRPDFRMEINLSGHSIGDPSIESAIIGALDTHGVDPAALVLEITETAAVADIVAAREFAERLTALGCRFALDDFGAGFGSFYYLKHLVFDYVKIDGEFVTHAPYSSVDRTILRSIVGIARDLGKETVAEFVSDDEILAVVQDEGIDFAQGYLLGRPVPESEFVEMLREPLVDAARYERPVMASASRSHTCASSSTVRPAIAARRADPNRSASDPNTSTTDRPRTTGGTPA